MLFRESSLLFLRGINRKRVNQVEAVGLLRSKSIRGEVAEWLDANWDRWERDKADWFNTVFIESVDGDIMPARVLSRLKQEAEGGARRRSSFMERVS